MSTEMRKQADEGFIRLFVIVKKEVLKYYEPYTTVY